MIKLFKYEGYTVTIEPEALMLAPFKALWKRDKSRDKSRAMQELAFIYFMGDPRSDYQYLVGMIDDQMIELERMMNFYRYSLHKGEKAVSPLEMPCVNKTGT